MQRLVCNKTIASLHELLVRLLCVGTGLYNPEEFSFTMDENPPEQMQLTKKLDTLKKKQQTCNKRKY